MPWYQIWPFVHPKKPFFVQSWEGEKKLTTEKGAIETIRQNINRTKEWLASQFSDIPKSLNLIQRSELGGHKSYAIVLPVILDDSAERAFDKAVRSRNHTSWLYHLLRQILDIEEEESKY